MKRTTTIGLAAVLALVFVAPLARAQVPAPADAAPSLDQLLQKVKDGWRAERKENQRREQEFRAARSEQEQLLEEGKHTLAALEERSEDLETTFEHNEVRLTELEALLAERSGNLGELFGVVRQIAGDTASNVETSLSSAQTPGRDEFLQELAQSKSLPSIEKLERLWFEMQREMTEQGKVVRFPATVVKTDGTEVDEKVVRVGVFNAVADGRYLRWNSETQRLGELGRQPAGRYLRQVASFEASNAGLSPLAIDPSRGVVLGLLVETPSFRERIDYGGVVGYTILLVLGLPTLVFGLARLAYVTVVWLRVRSQQSRDAPSTKNPLGRVLSVWSENKTDDVETLELKLDESILRESTKLERFLWLIKVVSVVAPLMGLLGTVTGMIQTFQAITLFGTGDPKLMAGGISEALVTTMLGLMVAIPLVLLHSVMSSVSRSVRDVLDEQAAGLVALRADQVSRE